MADNIDKVKEAIIEHSKTVQAHYARIEAKTDAFLAATERQIAALADLKHTALWIAGRSRGMATDRQGAVMADGLVTTGRRSAAAVVTPACGKPELRGGNRAGTERGA